MKMIERISPFYSEERRVNVSLGTSGTIRVGDSISVLFDYTDTDPSWIQVPLELVVQGSRNSGSNFTKMFRRNIPSEYTFSVSLADNYLVLIREMHHNKFFGSLEISVEGDRTSSTLMARRV